MRIEPKDLSINIYALEKECATQSERFAAAGLDYANKVYELNEAKVNKDLLEAHVATDARINPARYDLTKITEAAIKEAVIQNEKVIKANERVFEKSKEVEESRAIRDAFMQRSSMLKCEVDLFLASYYSDHSGEGNRKIVEQKLKRKGRNGRK